MVFSIIIMPTMIRKYLSFSLKGGDSDQHTAFSLISFCFEETKSWMADNFLQLNETKTDVFVVYSKSSRRKPSAIPLNIGSVQFFLEHRMQSWCYSRWISHHASVYCKNLLHILLSPPEDRQDQKISYEIAVLTARLSVRSVSHRLRQLISGWPTIWTSQAS